MIWFNALNKIQGKNSFTLLLPEYPLSFLDNKPVIFKTIE